MLVHLPIQYLFGRPAVAVLAGFDVIDEAGRPLHEGSSATHKPGDADYVECRYPDFRSTSGKPMNLRALQSIGELQADIFGYFSVVASACRSHGGDSKRHGVSIVEMFRLVAVCRHLSCLDILVKAMRGDELIRVDTRASAAFKYARGIQNLLLTQLYRGNDPFAQIPWREYVEQAFDLERLVGQRESCPASRSVIERTFRAIEEAFNFGSRDSVEDAGVKFGLLALEVELLALIYEFARAEATLQAPIRAVPTSQFAAPFMNVTMLVNEGQRPQAIARLSALVNTSISTTSDSRGARKMLLLAADAASTGSGWRNFLVSMDEQLNQANNELATIAGISGPKPITAKTLQNVFGTWPAMNE